MARNMVAYVLGVSFLEACMLTQFLTGFRLATLTMLMVVLNLIALTIWTTYVYPNFFSPLRHLPGPSGGNIIFGHAKQARIDQPRGDIPRRWMEEIPHEGLLRFRDFINGNAIILASHQTLKTVLSDNNYDFTKQPFAVNVLKPVLGEGLILVEGDVHKFQRKHLQPGFTGHVIHGLYPLFWNKACEMVRMLESEVNTAEIELGNWTSRTTLDIIGVAGLGRDFNSLRNPDDEIARHYSELMEPKKENAIFFGMSLVLPYSLVSKIPFWKVPGELKRISAGLHDFARNLAADRRVEFSQAEKKPVSDAQRKDVLSLLVKSNDFTDHELAAQVLTMMAAGHETTSTTLSWCICLLAQHPEIQTQLREEVRANLPSPTSPVTNLATSGIDELPLLSAVCHEILRLYPSVPITSRRCVRPTTLGGYDIAVGTNVYIVPWAINRLKAFWGDDALDFNPYRWIDIDEKGNTIGIKPYGGSIGPYALMTFLHGPRSCIGQGFAKAELKHLLAALIGRFEFTLTRDLKSYYPAGLVAIRPAKGMWVKLKTIEGW